jgi:hypothetical protein
MRFETHQPGAQHLFCEPSGVAKWPVREVDLHQGTHEALAPIVKTFDAINSPTDVSMPPLSKFKKLDVRRLLQSGREPIPEILARVEALKPDEGLIVVAPFLPSPLIERLNGEGFESKVETLGGGPWIVYFWRQAA